MTCGLDRRSHPAGSPLSRQTGVGTAVVRVELRDVGRACPVMRVLTDGAGLFVGQVQLIVDDRFHRNGGKS